MTDKPSPCPACAQQQFVEHLEQATQIVRSWPIWKQTVLGGNEAAIGDRTQVKASNTQQVSGDATSRPEPPQ